MRPIRFTIGNFAAASINNIAQTQAVAAGAFVVLNGSTVVTTVSTQSQVGTTINQTTAVLDAPRQIIITSAGIDTGVTFTITGTLQGGRTVKENLQGASIAAATSLNSFATVTSIYASAATASTIQVGTNTIADQIVPLDMYANPTDIRINSIVTGTVTFQIDQTVDDVFAFTPYTANPGAAGGPVYPPNWFALRATGSASVQDSLSITATAVRVKLTAFTAGAGNNVQFELVQAGGTTGS